VQQLAKYDYSCRPVLEDRPPLGETPSNKRTNEESNEEGKVGGEVVMKRANCLFVFSQHYGFE